MGDVTVIGLGLMGSALARAIQGAGFDLTVWSRSPAKMQSFVANGALGAPDVPSAFAASPVILICVDNYVAVNAFLQTDTVPSLLAGRTVVQLGAVRGTLTSPKLPNKHISMPHKVGATQSEQRYGFA